MLPINLSSRSFYNVFLLSTLFGNAYSAVAPPHRGSSAECRNIPGDAGWPKENAWDHLNRTVSGRLISTVPVGSVCHEPSYDEAKCAQLTQEWGRASVDVPRPADFMALYFQNNTCTPFTDKSTPCRLGNYASYSLNVSSPDDVRAGLRFAQRHNVRLVLKNSGHDFYGQSTGLGSLSLWMHNYNKKWVIPSYNSSYYSGPAIRVQTGVQGAEATSFGADNGYSFVVGTCPTVKPGGGYLAGGGHGFLSGLYGFGSDNVLEWEVITTDGRHVTASPIKNEDLYWALSGGGGGAFAIVLSVTFRVFPSEPVTMATLSFNSTQTGGLDDFWKAVSIFQTGIRPLLDRGMLAEYFISNDTFTLVGLLKSGNANETLQSAMAPVLGSLEQFKPATLNSQGLQTKFLAANNYRDLYVAEIEPGTAGNVFTPAVAGRLVPRKTLDENPVELHAALRNVTERGYFLAVIAFNTSNPVRARLAPRIAANSLQPNLADSFSSIIISPRWSNSLPWSYGQQLQVELMDDVLPILQAVTPGSGAYKNEANWAEKDLKASFYAGTYDRLAQIKQKWDSADVLYGVTSVGFDRWAADSAGRLCKVRG